MIDPIAQAFRTPALAKNARACPEQRTVFQTVSTDRS